MNKISNFRPVSILTTFSKICEKVAKRFLEADIAKVLFPFLFAYWNNSSTQDILFRLVEGWRETS